MVLLHYVSDCLIKLKLIGMIKRNQIALVIYLVLLLFNYNIISYLILSFIFFISD